MRLLHRFRSGRIALLALALGSIVSGASAQSVIGWGDYRFVPSAAQSGVAQISTRDFNRMALKLDGSVVTWTGQGGLPGVVPAEAQSGVTGISCGTGHYMAIKNGGVIAWGNDYGFGATSVPSYATSGVTAVAAGYLFSTALVNGGVKVWGANFYNVITVPAEAQSGIVALASGNYFVMALTSAGKVVAWGDNGHGETDVPVAAQSGVVAIAAGSNHALALKSDGSIVAWGVSYDGQTNVPSDALSGVTAITAGSHDSFGLKSDGTLVGFGWNNAGNRIPPATFHDVSSIAAATFTAFAVRTPLPAESIVSPNAVNAGTTATATVSLKNAAPAGGAVVTLATNDGGVHIPASVTVPEGQTTATYPVNVDLTFGGGRNPAISSTYGGETQQTYFYVAPRTASLAVNRSSVIAGSDQPLTLTLTMGAALTVPVTFNIAADQGIELPTTVTIPAGKTSVAFKALTNTSVGAGSYYDEWDDAWYPIQNNIATRYQGNGPSISFTATPLQARFSIASACYAGQIVSGLVQLNARPRASTPVAISTDDAGISSFSVSVLPGTSGANFSFVLPVDQPTHQIAVKASLNGTDAVRTITAHWNGISSVTTSSSSVVGGNSLTGTVSILYPMANDYTVTLASNRTTSATVPATVTIPAGSTSVTFPIATIHANNDRTVKISATRNGTTVTSILTVLH